MPKGIHKNITIPGLLAPALRLRSREFGFRTLSSFIVNLVAYDLERGARHTITLAIALDTQAAQDAVDAELVSRYRLGAPRDEGLLVQLVRDLDDVRSTARHIAAVEPLKHDSRADHVSRTHLEARGRPLG